jgi:hypothetical protein
MNDNKNLHSASGIGVVTLFVVLLILCLTVFSVLAFASANADLRLSEKNAEMVEAYYAADSLAALISAEATSFWKPGTPRPGEAALAEFEAAINDYGDGAVVYAEVVNTEDDTGHTAGESGLMVRYDIFVDTLLTLEVRLSLPRAGVCEVLSWRVTADEPEFEEDMMPVWEG